MRPDGELHWKHPAIKKLDHVYSSLDPSEGLYWAYEADGHVERVVDDARIERFESEPPEDTRAYFRGECLRRYGAAVFGVNWDSISFSVGDEPIKRIMMVEPLKGTKVHVEDLLANSPNAADLVKNLRA